MILTSICTVGTYLISSTIHLFCPNKFFFPDTVLYFLFDMSYISSHLRTNSINFSSISEEKPDSTRCSQTLEAYWTRTLDCSQYHNRAGSDRFGPVPSRPTFSLGDGTELRLDGDCPVSVNISI